MGRMWKARDSLAVLAAVALVPTLLGCQAGKASPGTIHDKAAAAKLTPETSVTIVPVVMAGDASKDVADVVGLMLEQEGMSNVWTTDAKFEPKADADWEDIVEAFGQWVATQKFEQDCAVFCQILGDRESGPSEVRAVIADKAGTVIWSDRQTPEDKEFKRAKPTNPMTCCMLLRDRLGPRFHLTAATRGSVKDGRMAKLWAEKSGTPTDEEHTAMERRAARLKQGLSTGKMLVYPVQSNESVGVEWTSALIDTLNRELKTKAEPAGTAIKIEIAPNSNEQRRLWDLARKFREQVRTEKPDADYTLVADYTVRPDNQEVWTVHFVMCDRDGEWVVVDFQNNHHADFNAIKPKTAADCAKLVTRRLGEYMK